MGPETAETFIAAPFALQTKELVGKQDLTVPLTLSSSSSTSDSSPDSASEVGRDFFDFRAPPGDSGAARFFPSFFDCLAASASSAALFRCSYSHSSRAFFATIQSAMVFRWAEA